MRPALPRCASSQLLLFDFLVPRLSATSRPRLFLANASLGRRTTTSRHSSVSATANATVSTPSILDVAGHSKGDLSGLAAHMRKRAAATDVIGVWTTYSRIHKKARLVLGPKDYGAVSAMLVKAFSKLSFVDRRGEDERHAMEELAFVCAGAGYVEGLRQMLLWLAANRETDRIIKAFERFEQTVLNLDESGLQTATDSPDPIITGDDLSHPMLENPDISRLDVTNIMAITVAGYAAGHRFHDALQFILRHATHRIRGDNLEELQRELILLGRSTACARRMTNDTWDYVEAGGMARLVRQPEAFKAHIRNLLREKDPLNRLGKVTRILREGFTGGERAWAANNEAQRSDKRPIVVSEQIWSYLVHAYIAAHKESAAQEIWAFVIRFGQTPGKHMWNALLEGYRDTRQPDKLLHTWEMMKKEGIPYDARSYGAKLGCLAQERHSGHYSLKIFEEFKQAKPNKEDSLFVYNTVINGLLSRNDMKTALSLMDEMRQNGPQPDVVTYNTFVSHHAKKANLRGIADVVRELTKAKIEPDVFTFTTILTAMLKARVPNGAERLLKIMEDMGVKQNVATYSAIIDSQVREGTRLGIRAAWALLQQMERMKDVQPNVVTYTSFLAGVHRSRELDKALISSISSDIVQMMKKCGIRLKLGTYHILIKACLQNLNRDALDFFVDYYNMMVADEIPFWHDTWYIILDGLVRRRAMGLAAEMKDQMLESGFQPMWGVLEKVKQIETWEREGRKNGEHL